MEIEQRLIQAVNAGDIQKINTILTQNPSLSSTITDKNVSLLVHAAYLKKNPVTEAISKFIPKPDFWESIVTGNIFFLKYHLIQDSKWIKSTSPDGYNPLTLACMFGHFDIVKKLVQSGCGINKNSKVSMPPIHAAIVNQDVQILKYLIKKGGDVNVKDQNDYTALHLAIIYDNLKIVNILLKNNADLSIENKEGLNAVTLALQSNNPRILRNLNKIPV